MVVIAILVHLYLRLIGAVCRSSTARLSRFTFQIHSAYGALSTANMEKYIPHIEKIMTCTMNNNGGRVGGLMLNFNPSNAMATFVQTTMIQIFLKAI